jgi:hypothetical protein
MDGAMWGLLRPCSCSVLGARGWVLSPGRTIMGCGGREGTKDREGISLEGGRCERKNTERPPHPDSHLPPRNKKMQTLGPNGAAGQQMTPFFICWWVGSDSGRQPVGEKEVAPPADAKKVQRFPPAQSSRRPSPLPVASSLTPKMLRTFHGRGFPLVTVAPGASTHLGL